MISVFFNNIQTGNPVYDLCIYKDPATMPFGLPIYNGTGKYIYPILLSSQVCTNWDLNGETVPSIVERTFGGYDNFFITIPDNVIADVRNNVCKIVFDYSNESADVLCQSNNEFAAVIVENTIKKYNLSKDDVLLCTANWKSTCNHKSFHMCVLHVCWQTIPINYQLAEKQSKQISEGFIRDKKVLCLMRLPHSHRLSFGQGIYKNNLLADNIVSLMSPEQTFKTNPRNKNIFKQKQFADQDFLNSLPWIADINHDDYVFNHNNIWQQTIKEVPWFINRPEEQKLYLQTYANCTVETVVDNTAASLKHVELDFSEKTFKPISTMQPFIIFGQPGILNHLKDMGYKTFDCWWDESYDRTIHTRSRQFMVMDIFKKLSNASHNELSNMLKEMLPVLEHNFRLFTDTIENKHYVNDFNQCIDRMFNGSIHSN